ncbi:dihydrofolate reductase [Streptococcus constellatus]|uniref:dihydrofolate reductase n=1 Tax=Streptococcus constellatus TaxID=76860 RepID=UPI0018993992|nr:dihydrofolate reductase [Streptococcus constellatus]
MTKKIVAIWAQDKDGLIGRDNRLPWHLPADLKHFKETTTGQVILMGRMTFDGMNRRVLPNRTTIILTRDKSYQVENEHVLIFHDVTSVLKWYEMQEKELYIIGGGQIFSAFGPFVDELVMTRIHASLQGDTYFPKEFDMTKFQECSRQFYAKDEKNEYDFTVTTFQRKES